MHMCMLYDSLLLTSFIAQAWQYVYMQFSMYVLYHTCRAFLSINIAYLYSVH